MIFSKVPEATSPLYAPGHFEMLLMIGATDSASSIALVNAARAWIGPQMPMLCLVSRNQFHDVNAIRLGTMDEVMVRPLSFFELFSLLRLFMRKLRRPLPALEREWGDYRFLLTSNMVEYRQKRVQLRPDGFDLAIELFSNAGSTVGRDLLWAAVWAKEWDHQSRQLDVCISGLRSSLELALNGWELRAVWGAGYRLEGPSVHAPKLLPSRDAPLTGSQSLDL
ncbi:DNA-binding response OmpR family regulator [Variovorax sp. SG517]|uniref:winged helix-turn-helix domain-containing protein n=1 Tax=Variovorax sp. SG517 TaxID=2587117 RepID=UPI00159D5C75|nr:DNA-binding response OmpR family regulator [Variovorax sp. SG517]